MEFGRCKWGRPHAPKAAGESPPAAKEPVRFLRLPCSEAGGVSQSPPSGSSPSGDVGALLLLLKTLANGRGRTAPALLPATAPLLPATAPLLPAPTLRLPAPATDAGLPAQVCCGAVSSGLGLQAVQILATAYHDSAETSAAGKHG